MDFFLPRAKVASGRKSLESTTATVDSYDDDNAPYWEDEDWVPLQKNGKQRTPNMIRNELQRYIDNTPNKTQTAVMKELGVNANSFRRFMNPKSYKDPWSATENGTYWAAARFLEAQRNKPKETKKRKAEGEATTTNAPVKKAAKADMESLMDRIVAHDAPEVSEKRVYDTCPEIIKKIKDFLAQDGVTKAAFCRALGGINANSMNQFMASKKQDRAGNITYRRAWVFFEKKRLLEGQPKSKARIKNEKEHPQGFELQAPIVSRSVLSLLMDDY